MTDFSHNRLLFHTEGQKLLDSISDEMTRSLVGAFLVTLYREVQSGFSPRSAIDFEFLVRTLIRFSEKHDLIRSIVTGGEFGSWPD